MHHPSRPPNRSDGSTAVSATQGSRGTPPPVGAAGASAQSSGEPDAPSRRRPKPISPVDSLGVFQTRSIFHLPRRASSGYFSSDGDSQPSSPLSPRPVAADKATQTASPAAQVILHAQQRMAVELDGPGAHRLHEYLSSHFSAWPQNAAGDMQVAAIGRELQRIGDDFNRELESRREAARLRRDVIHPNALPHIHQESALLLCFGLLLLLIGRIIYLQGRMDSQDHSQV